MLYHHSKLAILAIGVMLTVACNSEGSTETLQSSTESGRAVALAGTWEGNLNCNTGDSTPYIFKVAATGNPIFEYMTKSGSREEELSYPGQRLRFVPPQGGIVNLVVDSLSVSPSRINFAMVASGERTSEYGSNATLSQSQGAVIYEATLSGIELDVQMTIQSQTTLSQTETNSLRGGEQVVCRGRLRT